MVIHMPKPNLTEGGTGRSPVITLRLPTAMLERLNEMAAEQGRNRGELIRSMIEDQVMA